jgi:hypothetical protein
VWLSGSNSDSVYQTVARVPIIARFPSSPPTDETLFEFLREFDKTADRIPPDPLVPTIEARLRTSMTRAQEVYHRLETRG